MRQVVGRIFAAVPMLLAYAAPLTRDEASEFIPGSPGNPGGSEPLGKKRAERRACSFHFSTRPHTSGRTYAGTTTGLFGSHGKPGFRLT
jgi:hypothetical protein